jgi:hypothetical protein
LQKNEKTPYSHNTVADALGAVVRKLHEQFRAQIGDNINAFFPEDEVKRLKNWVRSNSKRSLCEDESDVFKNSIPIPREITDRTTVFEPDNIPEAQCREAAEFGKLVNMLNILKHLFKTAQFGKLLKLLLTFNGIGRGGEVKFLSYQIIFLELFYNILFVQWFQRKILKTNPSGFAPDFVHSTLCVFLAFGCYWACEDGLYQPDGMGEVDSLHHRKMQFVFQDLHEIRDDAVSDQITRYLRSFIPNAIRMFFLGNLYTLEQCRC